MKQIKTFVQKNQMTVVAATVMLMFGAWMYSAHKNMVERDAQREARIEAVIANGGSFQPSEELNVGDCYVADCQD